MPDSRITKRRVTSTTYTVGADGDGAPVVQTHQVVDYVRPDFLDAYVQHQLGNGWQSVTVSEEPDAGPGGYDGATYVPDALPHPDAGLYFPPTSGSSTERALVQSGDEAAIATEGSDKPVQLAVLLAGTDTQEN